MYTAVYMLCVVVGGIGSLLEMFFFMHIK
jgi:hypothetical protein